MERRLTCVGDLTCSCILPAVQNKNAVLGENNKLEFKKKGSNTKNKALFGRKFIVRQFSQAMKIFKGI